MSGSDRFRVLILGYGEMGHAMERLLATRHSLSIWQRRPPAGASPLSLDEAVAESDFIVFCLPATAHAEVSARIAPHHTESGAVCLTIAKGLDDQSRIPAEVLGASFRAERVAVLYGPMISEEILAGKPAFAQCGAAAAPVAQRVAELFAGSALAVEPGRDITGLSWSAILKNVYALAFGMADALDLGDNVRGYLAVTALREMSAVVRLFGGHAETPYQLAGLGDLITTATSRGSHHHELGGKIARADRRALTGEGIHTLAMLRAHPRFEAAHFPLFSFIEDCVREPLDVPTRMSKFLKTAHPAK